jgi:DNA mismatch repair protein MutL
MSTIRILPADVANRIAAGEVIERPASVVKELVENAIDAGATRVRVQTAQGGQRLIQVTDDGCGMDRDDALLCIEAHATSKISDTADVGQIRTLGFRGEALPSISAVSRFHLQTRKHDDPTGTEILVEAGKLTDVNECGCAPGSNIRVTHLFARMPARRKFLRGPSTEDGHIQEIVLLQALAHPDIGFELTANGREVLRASQAADLETRIGMLMGRETLDAMLPVDYEESGIRVHGFVSKPGFTRSSRREQRVFVNSRPASAEVVYYGLRDAYNTLVVKGRYPPVVLYLDLAADRVDVNVHPAKREVRFREARLVGQVVAAAVRRALRSLAFGEEPDAVPPDVDSGLDRASASPSVAPAPFSLERAPSQPGLPLPPSAPRPSSPASSSPASRSLSGPRASDTAASAVSAPGGASSAPPPVQGDSASSVVSPVPPPVTGSAAAGGAFPVLGGGSGSARHSEIGSLHVLGVFRKRYLVAEGSHGLVLIDQRAAHQRILFEKLLSSSRDRRPAQQQLLLPATIDLGAEDAKLLQRELEQFQRIGFGIEHFGGNTFLIVAVPAQFPREDVSGMLRDILDELREGTGSAPRPDDIRIARAACTHAVRASDTLSHEEIRSLLRDLSATDMPYTCPNGRPVMVNLPVAEIDKRFGRGRGQPS